MRQQRSSVQSKRLVYRCAPQKCYDRGGGKRRKMSANVFFVTTVIYTKAGNIRKMSRDVCYKFWAQSRENYQVAALRSPPDRVDPPNHVRNCLRLNAHHLLLGRCFLFLSFRALLLVCGVLVGCCGIFSCCHLQQSIDGKVGP